MLETPHALTGAVLAAYAPNPVLGLVLAFLSHFAVDMLPHWNWRPDARPLSLLGIMLDLILAEILIFYLFFQNDNNWLVLGGAFAAILPDLLEAPLIFLGTNDPFLKKLCDFQERLQNNTALIPGVVSQILLVAVCFKILLP